MDPNQTLSDLRVAVLAWKGADDKLDFIDPVVIGWHIVESFEALDSWITQGGFLPDAWRSL